jgi:hypothetical protein
MKVSSPSIVLLSLAVIVLTAVLGLLVVAVFCTKKKLTQKKRPSLVIVTSHFQEDLTWLHQSSWPVVVVSKFGANPAAIPVLAHIPNSGADASAYLYYIVTHYNRLPDHVAFIHGHEEAWHMKAGGILEQLSSLPLRSNMYHTLNNCYIYDWKAGNNFYDALAKVWPVYFQKWLGDLPPFLLHDCCAQFVVSRDRILGRPLEAYQSWFELTQDTSLPAKLSAYFFEYTWHLIMGEPAVNHPPADVHKQ